MTTISATKTRNNLYSLIDEANESHIPIQITGKRGNAVLISEVDWRAISGSIHKKNGSLKTESRFENNDSSVSPDNCSTNYQVRFLWRLDFKRLRRLWLFILRRRFFFRLPMEIVILC